MLRWRCVFGWIWITATVQTHLVHPQLITHVGNIPLKLNHRGAALIWGVHPNSFSLWTSVIRQPFRSASEPPSGLPNQHHFNQPKWHWIPRLEHSWLLVWNSFKKGTHILYTHIYKNKEASSCVERDTFHSGTPLPFHWIAGRSHEAAIILPWPRHALCGVWTWTTAWQAAAVSVPNHRAKLQKKYTNYYNRSEFFEKQLYLYTHRCCDLHKW